MVREKQCDAVMIYRLDRLVRSHADEIAVRALFRKANVDLVSVTEPRVTAAPQGASEEFMMDVLSAATQLERGLIAERVALSIHEKRRMRQSYTRYAPYGFDKHGKRLEVNAEEMAVIRRIFKWRERKRTFYWIAKTLNDTEVPTKTGKIGRWLPHGIAQIVWNPIYTKEAMKPTK